MIDRAHARQSEKIPEDFASAATERALGIYNQMKPCDEATLASARKIIADHIDTLIGAGERDEQRLVVRALTHLKALDRETTAENAASV